MTTTRIDKRLRPAKIIGIILFVISIVYFATSIIGGLMTLMMFPDTDMIFGSTSFFSVLLEIL